jgi:GTP:adenosylcobinamide-phosphate guanylyltransferase
MTAMVQAECSIAIKCADDPLIERCLDSIDDPGVAINVVATPSPRIEALLEKREVPYSLTSYGNIAKAAQISVEEAAHDHVIVMDSDAYFAPGAINILRNAIETAPVAKPRLEFQSDGYPRLAD